MFHIFSEPPSGSHFWRVEASVYPQKWVLGPIFDFPGLPKFTLEAIFSTKRRQKGSLASPGKRPGADLGAICPRKHSKDTFFPIWTRFGSILEGLLINLAWIFYEIQHMFDAIFDRIPSHICFIHFSNNIKSQPHEHNCYMWFLMLRAVAGTRLCRAKDKWNYEQIQ